MPIHLLLIDDDPILLTAFSDMISFHFPSIQFTAVDSGVTALEELEKQPYDIVICDLMMPGMDGMMTLAEIRKDHPHLPIYLMTGHPEPEKVYRDTQATGFFNKPLDRAYFLDFMKRTVRVISVNNRVTSTIDKASECVSSVKRFLEEKRVIDAPVASSISDS